MKTASVLIGVVALTGCAAKPESIAPAYVSDLSYNPYSCEQLGAEQARMSSALGTASDAQRHARSNDTVGVILLGLPVSSLSGSNQASQIARLKGELEALQRVGIQKSCGLPTPVVAVAETKKPVIRGGGASGRGPASNF